MGKKEKSISDQIKEAIDSGNLSLAQELMSSLQIPTEKKKRGRPPKSKTPLLEKVTKNKEIIVAAPEPVRKQPADISSCIAPTRRKDAPPQTIEKDGKVYTVSKAVEWTPPEQKNKFTDTRQLHKNEMGLNYPKPSDRRPATEPSLYICRLCDAKDYLYPGSAPPNDMLYTCSRCLKRMGR